jgi:hypothetical protein
LFLDDEVLNLLAAELSLAPLGLLDAPPPTLLEMVSLILPSRGRRTGTHARVTARHGSRPLKTRDLGTL